MRKRYSCLRGSGREALFCDRGLIDAERREGNRMKPICLWVTSLIFLIPMSPALAEDTWVRCPEEKRRIGKLEATGVGCGLDRWVARRYDEKVTDGGHWPGDRMRVGEFSCRARQTGYEPHRVRCVRDSDEVVRFTWGV